MMFNQQAKRFSLAAICGFAAMVALPVASFADLVVMSSTAPGYKTGSEYSTDTVFKIPAGKYVKLRSENGETYRLKGPFSGRWNSTTSAGTSKNCSGWFGCSHVSNGSSRGEEPGVTRGMKKD